MADRTRNPNFSRSIDAGDPDRWHALSRVALALILGGALGNAIDRLLYGHVIDFLQFHWGGWAFPSFNVADSAITLGAVLLIVDELRRVRGAR